MNFIELEKFIQEMLEEFAEAYIYYIIRLKESSVHEYAFQMSQILTATPQPTILRNNYNNFDNIFSIKKFDNLVLYKNHDHIMNFIENC